MCVPFCTAAAALHTQLVKETYRDLHGSEPKVSAVHAGLECGILGSFFPGMVMISFGPTIHHAHSPDEAVQVSTVQPFWQLTLAVLERIAKGALQVAA